MGTKTKRKQEQEQEEEEEEEQEQEPEQGQEQEQRQRQEQERAQEQGQGQVQGRGHAQAQGRAQEEGQEQGIVLKYPARVHHCMQVGAKHSPLTPGGFSASKRKLEITRVFEIFDAKIQPGGYRKIDFSHK